MKTKLTPVASLLPPSLLLAAMLNLQPSTMTAQTTAFTYQGRLIDAGGPANGSYDLQASLQDAASNIIAGPLIAPALVSNGLFTIILDFGSSAWPGADRWLQLAVRTNGGGAFTPIFPRQPLTPAPYAIRAGAVGAAGIQGTISDNALSANIPRLNGTGQVFSGALTFSNVAKQFNGNGSCLAALNP